ncbi:MULTISPECIES: hypothetical protein [Dehalococcoides]|uniref:PD(D/E)XK endonuclease domain-containing protein n=1 Tax=Dehalococcoides mccartyi TaxID=61435 RepID=A0AB38ZAF2_9CHLR|nr:hypothetical protein [Dehalococcoides mccartyi]OBW61889.1 MAG: hypothetical protein A9181_02605 [Dehalococcoides mccartyi]WRO07575.1 hypothetical protein VLL09_01395 [Dehalococcoides mccartyi]
MNEPDSQQRGLAGEYYVAFCLSRLGYDIGITIGRAKVFDMMATCDTGRTINIQVKSTYHGYDWLVADKFDTSENSIVALVRLGLNPKKQPELYFLSGNCANKLITHKYQNHSPRIGRSSVQKEYMDHDFEIIERILRG